MATGKKRQKAQAEKAKRKAARMRRDGRGNSRYALKRRGEIEPDYRLEGSPLLTPEEIVRDRMPAPYVVQLVKLMEQPGAVA